MSDAADKQAADVFEAVALYIDERVRNADAHLNSWANETFKSIEESFGARIAALEQARTMAFRGPHDPSERYWNGDVVQRSGSVFVCMADNPSGKPGESSDWRRIASDR